MRILLALWLAASLAGAANRYVYRLASGSATGNDWSNAYTNLPSSLTRGDTYYVAEGDDYGIYDFNDATSGSSWITIKKATTNDHGTDTGWSNAYADGQAKWTQWSISADYMFIDGVTGGGPGSWTNGHGFYVGAASSGTDGILSTYNSTKGNLVMKNVEVDGKSATGPPYATGIYMVTFGSGFLFQSNYVHDWPGDMHQYRGLKNVTNEFNYFARNFQDATRHGDFIENDEASTNHIFRYNIVEDCRGTYLLGHHNAGVFDTYLIYGNVIWFTTSYVAESGNGMFATLTSGTGKLINAVVAQNTIFNMLNGGSGNGSLNPHQSSTLVASNNIFHFKSGDTSTSIFIYGTNVTHGYNWHINRTVSGDNAINSSGDPFVNSGALNFQLTTNSIAGATLGSPFTADMLGTNFNVSGTWTRGALAFSGAGGGGGSATTKAVTRGPMVFRGAVTVR